MSRSWWIRGFFFLLLVAAAVVFLVPTVIPYEHQPDFIQRHFHRTIRPAIGIQPGLRLVYEIDLERVISLRMDSVAQGLVEILRHEHPGLTVKVERQGGADILLAAPKLGPELSYPNVMQAGGGWVTESERDDRAGTIRLRFDADKTAEVRETAIRTAMEALDSHMDATRCSGERLTREGDRIVLELPGLQPANAERVKAIVARATSHPASLKFVIVENDPDYLRKIAAALPPDSGIELVTGMPP